MNALRSAIVGVALLISLGSATWHGIASAKNIEYDTKYAIALITLLLSTASRLGQKAIEKKSKDNTK